MITHSVIVRLTKEERKALKTYCAEKETSAQTIIRDYIRSLVLSSK